MQISETAWLQYIGKLRKINNAATERMKQYLRIHGRPETRTAMNALIEYAFKVSTTFGEAAAALASEMYDAIALASGTVLPPALPAAPPDIDEVARTIAGTAKTENEDIMSAAIGRLVKRAAVDTTMYNAIRDGAEWAWIPHGDTCAFCLTLASRGWQRASKKALKGGHAEHIHANCDCVYMPRFNENTNVEGYEPEKYLEMYESAPGRSSKDKINAMRRDQYEQNKERINEQKRAAYAARKEREGSSDD